MECKVKCKSCQRVYSVNLLAEYRGKMVSFSCPHCQSVGSLKLTPELWEKAELLHKRSQANKAASGASSESGNATYVPGMKSEGTGAHVADLDETYVPGISDEKPKRLTLLVRACKELGTPSQSFVIEQDYNMIGRKNSDPQKRPDIEIETQDLSMSRKHCLIRKNGYGWFSIEDHNSANGTIINGKRIEIKEALYLNDGDVIEIGRTTIAVSFK